MKLKIKKLHPDAVMPQYAHEGDSGFDLVALEDVELLSGDTKLIKTGLSFEIPKGYELQVRPRSGMSLKTALRVANAPGTVDSSFRGEVCIIITLLVDHKTLFYQIKKGDRIAQGVICPVVRAEFELVEELSATIRDSNGFGSSGIK